MTEWQWIKFKYYYHPFGRQWKYSSAFPWRVWWITLFEGSLIRDAYKHSQEIKAKPISRTEKVRQVFRVLQGKDPYYAKWI